MQEADLFRRGELASGRKITPEKATIGDLCALVLKDARLRKLRDAKHQEWRYEAKPTSSR
jgi:hypothetical protein